ncbi:HGL064Wp [Eremothecium sinecaudum]|uniref:Golgi apparatus membrane protein TVP18 n=1 Tax=Eremothecium sinecaudum TaxID=45286 RepID=A0A109V046_9SACH|nr:HGL064Wp [Eremothecium sinecaudum]AMD22276.1 HGL064Wp [Eremothecium sinecaudum]
MAVSLKRLVDVPKIITDLKSFNFSIYGRWFGYINIILCLALGIANLFHFSLVILFAVIAILQGFVLLFTELPFLLKICPLSENFVGLIKRWESNGSRSLFYIVMAVIQWVSLAVRVTSLIVVAIGLTISAIFYGTGYLKKQEFKETNYLRDPSRDPNFPREAAVRDMV